MSILTGTYRPLTNALPILTQTEGGTPLTLVYVTSAGNHPQQVAYFATDAGTLYRSIVDADTTSRTMPTPTRLATQPQGREGVERVATFLGLTVEEVQRRERQRVEAVEQAARARRLAYAVDKADALAEGTPLDVTHPQYADGADFEVNAHGYVEAFLAEHYLNVRGEQDAVTAARSALEMLDELLRSTARHAPRSTDWTALPRWAAFVEALAGNAKYDTVRRALVGIVWVADEG